MTWHYRSQTIQVQRKPSPDLEPIDSEYNPRTPHRTHRHRSFKQIMLQCYRIREEPERKCQAEAEYLLGQELRYIQDHAFHDEGNNSLNPSPGEQDATVTSIIKTESGEPIVIKGEVLCDPKIRYIHPSLKRSL